MGRYFRITTHLTYPLMILGSISTTYGASLETNRIGHLSDAQTTAQMYELGDERVLLGLRKMGDNLNRECKFAANQCTYRILVDPKINALSSAPCYIYITTGLLDFVQSPDELAAVIGHELAHIRENHWEEANKATILPRAMGGAIVGGIAASAAAAAAIAIPPLVPGAILYQYVAASIAGKLAGKATTPVAQSFVEAMVASYTREQEYTADAMGARCAQAIGYDRHALIRFFERLEKLPDRSSEVNALNHFLKEKPSLEERKQKLEAAIQ